ncbi:uncharacterized protein LOC106012372 [Aplysia californica]|uniref:Uncharacterized protein LOC106012372 n=1 Tax=Aplysia californica TaxID=6500 RepID=A0ABM1VWR9_APLCA|nr:uncharacterized protein LOC106012372 [Aplysia californica]
MESKCTHLVFAVVCLILCVGDSSQQQRGSFAYPRPVAQPQYRPSLPSFPNRYPPASSGSNLCMGSRSPTYQFCVSRPFCKGHVISGKVCDYGAICCQLPFIAQRPSFPQAAADGSLTTTQAATTTAAATTAAAAAATTTT